MTPEERKALLGQMGQIFTPAAPINEDDLFAGRHAQLQEVVDAINQKGRHAIIYGERGVGKTSLANVLAGRLSAGVPVIAPRVNCDASDNYSTLWRKIFGQINITRTIRKAGFNASQQKTVEQVSQSLPDELSPDYVKTMLTLLAQGVCLLVIIDEFDRLTTKHLKALIADTIKTLSDYATPATLVVVGVADSVDELIEGHQSIERALVQVRMPRMSADELKQIIQKGVTRLGMAIDADAMSHIAVLSQGLPHYTHLLALNSCREAVSENSRRITMQHVEHATKEALRQAQQTILTSYHKATASHRKGNLYPQVLLACALAPTDELGYFAAADVREPMSAIMGRQYDIPSYSRHLYDFCEPERGPILGKTGVERRFRFRFKNPLLQPFITMQGLSAGLITRELLTRLEQARGLRVQSPEV